MRNLQYIQAHSSSHFLMEGAIMLLSFSLLFCSHALVSPGSSNGTTTDELALLSFKSMLSKGSSEGSLVSWNSSSRYCSWPGVLCGSRQHATRVVALHMDSFNLSGCISPFLSNLSFLRELHLGDNHLAGMIPSELGRLAKLRVLNLSTNSLHGTIPVALGGCTNLTTINLSYNQLQGDIPTEIGSNLKNLVYLNLEGNALSGQIPGSLAELPSIEILFLESNKLSGEIPPGLGNLSTLRALFIGSNTLFGSIPSSFGMFPRLSFLDLAINNLSGVIPTSFWNISSLKIFSAEQNMLSGTIPPNAFSSLAHLQEIYLNSNQFHGHIPASVANASDMSLFQLSSNSFSGIIPPGVGRLRNLSKLLLAVNLLEAKEPRDWEFITALTNCSQLQFLELGYNRLSGVLPDSLSNLSTTLWHLLLAGNKISGSIPEDIGNLVNLQALFLHTNSLTGTLPSSLSRIKSMIKLTAYENQISGSVPWAIGNLTELIHLDISMNAFYGMLPSTLGNLTKLTALSLSTNNFTGPVPNGLFNITTLSLFFDLSYNNLEGSIPQEIGNLINLVEFYADTNKFSGEIPANLGRCRLLRNLYLENNMLHGSIPSFLSQLEGLETIHLANNNLSGQIPTFLGNLTMLYYLNLSFNNFVGEVPNFGVFANASAISIQGNGNLCGGIHDLHLSACPSNLPKGRHKSLVIPIVASLIATLVLLPLLYKLLICHKKIKTKIPSTTSFHGHPLISYSELVKATDGFSTSNLLGSGSCGSVYKGELDDQAGEIASVIAVKVLKIHSPGALKSFTAECEALRNMRHRNLVKIITVCSSIDSRGNEFKAIVYDIMPNGSLEDWLHPDANDQAEQKHLNLRQRVTILLDVAYALDYLHRHGPEPTVHCDVKASNVLLDADMVAHVGDFGLARILVDVNLILEQSTSSMGFRGTIGYAAPEYGAGNVVSTNGDIYSYGILVLETVTGKRPTDNGFRDALSVREYVDVGLPEGVRDIVDMRLFGDLENGLQTANERKIDCLASLLTLGMACSQELPSSRMATEDIVKALLSIRQSLPEESRM